MYYNNDVSDLGINSSARRHGVADEDIHHAIAHALYTDEIDPEPPVRQLHLGGDTAGNMLEVVTLHFDDGGVLAIHAMKMRKQYQRLLERKRYE